jgi:hypothetical protein
VSGTIRKAAKAIVLNGVDKDTPGITIDRVGDMKDIGEVYYSPKAAANILSFAAMTDAGAEISYDEKHGRFTMRPKGSENIYRQTWMRREVLCMRHQNNDRAEAYLSSTDRSRYGGNSIGEYAEV